MASLYIDRRQVRLDYQNGALICYEQNQRTGSFPLAAIDRVILRGDMEVNISVLGQLGKAGIGVIVLSGRKAEPSLLYPLPHNDARRRFGQYRLLQQPELQSRLARVLVQSKIQAQIHQLERQQPFLITGHRRAYQAALSSLNTCLAETRFQTELSVLRGLEGVAAQQYFAGLRGVLAATWGFEQRNRRPPRDPFNALLSLGYTLLQSEAVLVCYSLGLDPFIGCLHEPDFGRESLACDLMEPLRVLVDELSLNLLRHSLSTEHFSSTAEGCLLSKTGRERYYPAYDPVARACRTQLEQFGRQLLRWIEAGQIPKDSGLLR